MAAKDYKSMSLPDLKHAHNVVEKQIVTLRVEYKLLAAALGSRHAEGEAIRKYQAMSDPEKAALAKVLGAKGIDSGEAVGTPGG